MGKKTGIGRLFYSERILRFASFHRCSADIMLRDSLLSIARLRYVVSILYSTLIIMIINLRWSSYSRITSFPPRAIIGGVSVTISDTGDLRSRDLLLILILTISYSQLIADHAILGRPWAYISWYSLILKPVCTIDHMIWSTSSTLQLRSSLLYSLRMRMYHESRSALYLPWFLSTGAFSWFHRCTCIEWSHFSLYLKYCTYTVLYFQGPGKPTWTVVSPTRTKECS